MANGLNKILFVEDDPMVAELAVMALEEFGGLELNHCISGADAVAQFHDFAPDMLLLDVMMPEMDGYEAMAHIRSQPRFAALPVLALTAKAMKDDRAKCLDAGANDYCSKPIDMSKLTSLMRVWLHK